MAVKKSYGTRRFKTFNQNNNELLAALMGLITSVAFFCKQLGGLGRVKDDETFLAIIDILNIAILVVALVSIRAEALIIESKEYEKIIKRLGLRSEHKCGIILIRTNELVRQLVYCIRWFVIILSLFYLLQLFGDLTQLSYDKLKSAISTTPSIIRLLVKNQPIEVASAEFLTLEIFTNATNLFSAAFLFVAFQVLFLVTIDSDNRTWILKSYIPMSIAVILTIGNILFFLVGFFGAPLSNISHFIRLLGGIYNGVAMSLLFSRFISMEYFFQNSRHNWQRSFYFLGTVIFLPLYVVAQPLYGIFNAVEIDKSGILFKSIVFLICFWGKLFFLLFIYTMLSKKWIHAYIFMVLSQRDSLKEISNDLNNVDNF